MKDSDAHDEEMSRSSATLLEGKAEETKAMLKHAEFENAEFEDVPLRDIKRERRRWLKPLSLAINLLLFFLILLILSNPCFFSARKCVYAKSGGAKDDGEKPALAKSGDELLMSDANHIVPEFPTERVTFQNDSRYAHTAMFDTADEYRNILNNWRADMPIGRGFVKVDNSSAYPYLQRPWHLRGQSDDGYSIAYLHQYHCLFMILKAHGEVRLGLQSAGHGNGHDGKEAERHVTHCFDYLRQSIYCAGDSALEGKSATPGLEMTDGWGDVHVCKKRDQQLKWVVDTRLSDKHGID